MFRPLLLIDVDGVISIWGFDPGARPPGTFVMADGIPHFLAQEAVEHLQALGTRYERVWCTGWEERANEVFPAAIGLGPFPHVDLTTAHPEPQAHWKLAGIDALVPRDRADAWVDDAHDEACARWAAARPGPTLLVATDPARGLTAREARVLHEWRPSP